MIIVKLQGGLGNQLFQWAFAKSLQLKYNTDLILDINFLLQNISGITKRNYELYKFPKLKSEPIIKIQQYYYGSIINDNSNINNIKYNNTNLLLHGYFQHKKYISLYHDSICQFLQPNLKDININSNLLEKITNTNSVSVHVRRNDYLTSNGFHPVQPIGYYNNAISKIKEYDNLFVFSDDINWCKNYLSYKNIHFIENLDCVQDLWLMSLCKHNIIANSSFSWWAAYLNRNVNKTVIAPQTWFGSSNLDNDSLVMDDWITIE